MPLSHLPALAVRPLRRPRRRPRPPLRPAPAPAAAAASSSPAAAAPSPPGSAPPASPTTSAPPTPPSVAAGRRADAPGLPPARCAVAPLLARPPATACCSPSTTRRPRATAPCVEGAGIHHNPTPGPAGEKFVYGHVWVTLAWPGRPPRLGRRRPAAAGPALRPPQGRARTGPATTRWPFRTKLELAVELAALAAAVAGQPPRQGAVGGGRRRLRQAALPQAGAGTGGRGGQPAAQGRRPVDACPCRAPPGQRGPLPTYGKERIDLAKRAGQQRGWQQVECVQYGETVVKKIKTFVATWRPAGGRIRVVLVREDGRLGGLLLHRPGGDRGGDPGGDGRPRCDRADVQGREGGRGGGPAAGAERVRQRRGVHREPVLYSVVEAWAWERLEEELVDRSGAPWDTEARRPSHADKRKALQREVLREEIRAAVGEAAESEEFQRLANRLLNCAAEHCRFAESTVLVSPLTIPAMNSGHVWRTTDASSDWSRSTQRDGRSDGCIRARKPTHGS